MDLCQVESFVVLSEELHFGRAAERMGCSQPAFSQKIKRLEEYVGFDVVDRSNRQVKLTRGGAAFLPNARKLLLDIDAMISSASPVTTETPNVLVTPVLSESLAVGMASESPLAEQSELFLSDLSEQAFILFPRLKEPELYDQLTNVCSDHGFAPNVVQTASGFQVLLSLAAAGVGIMFVTESSQRTRLVKV